MAVTRCNSMSVRISFRRRISGGEDADPVAAAGFRLHHRLVGVAHQFRDRQLHRVYPAPPRGSPPRLIFLAAELDRLPGGAAQQFGHGNEPTVLGPAGHHQDEFVPTESSQHVVSAGDAFPAAWRGSAGYWSPAA